MPAQSAVDPIDLAGSQSPSVGPKTALVARSLRAWAHEHGLSTESRIGLVALGVTGAAPELLIDRLTVISKSLLWLCAIDDVFDESRLPLRLLEDACAQYVRQAAGARTTRWPGPDTLGTALQSIVEAMRPFPLFGELRAHWAGALDRTLAAMSWEYRASDRYRTVGNASALPTFDAYMDYGRVSIGLPLYAAVVMATSDDPSVVDHVAAMQVLVRDSGTCVRLANDLGTHARDVVEGKVNSLVVRHAEIASEGLAGNDPWMQARASIRGRAITALNRARVATRAVQTPTREPESAIFGCAAFASGFYARDIRAVQTTAPA
jgi:hypothetical protein